MKFQGTFQMWEYLVSHAQLLLRGPKGHSRSKNVDMIFVDVRYIELPTIMSDPEIVEPSPAEHQRAEQLLGRPMPAREIFVFVVNDHRYVVLAGELQVSENDLGMFESSLERFGGPPAHRTG